MKRQLALLAITVILLFGLLAGSGSRIWSWDAVNPYPPAAVGDLDGDGGEDVLVANATDIWLLSGSSGEPLWHRGIGVVGFAVLDGVVLVVDASGTIHGIQLSSGSDRYGVHLGFRPREFEKLGSGYYLAWSLGNSTTPARAYLAYTGGTPEVIWGFSVSQYSYSDSPFYARPVGDVDGDGRGDVLLLCNVIYQQDMYVRVWIVSSQGGVIVDENLTDRQVFPSPRSVSHEDLDRDSEQEAIVVARDRYGNFWLFLLDTEGITMLPMGSLTSLVLGDYHPDLDGDGVPDIPCFGTGELAVLSGQNGHVIWGREIQNIRLSTVTADLDGDTIGDVLVLTTDTLLAASLADGGTLYQVQAGRPYPPVGDFDDDGVQDVPICDEGEGILRLISGADGSTLWTTSLVLDPPIREVRAVHVFDIPGLSVRNSSHLQLSFYGYGSPSLVEEAAGAVGAVDLDGDGAESDFLLYSPVGIYAVRVVEVWELPSI